MAMKDLIPWNNRGREVGMRRDTDVHPFFTLHREMNRMFDDVISWVRSCAVRSKPSTGRPWLAPDRR